MKRTTQTERQITKNLKLHVNSAERQKDRKTERRKDGKTERRKDGKTSSRCDTGLVHDLQLTWASGESETKGKGEKVCGSNLML